MAKLILFSLFFTIGCSSESIEVKYHRGHSYIVLDSFNGFKHGRGLAMVHDPDCNCHKMRKEE